MTVANVVIRPETPLDDEAIERLHERAFGPGRYARTAFRLREQDGSGAPRYCFAAYVGTFLAGSVRLSAIWAGELPGLILGPLTVDPSFEGVGVGSALMRRSLAAAAEAGEALVLLVGDEPYYARFGFAPAPHGQLSLPGPVDPRRFLFIELRPGAMSEAHGAVKPRFSDMPTR